MDTDHILFDCKTWRKERRKMRERYKKDGRGQLRTVRQLMGSRRAIPAVPGFIAATRVGQRAQRQEQEVEMQEKRKNKAWELLRKGLRKTRKERQRERMSKEKKTGRGEGHDENTENSRQGQNYNEYA